MHPGCGRASVARRHSHAALLYEMNSTTWQPISGWRGGNWIDSPDHAEFPIVACLDGRKNCSRGPLTGHRRAVPSYRHSFQESSHPLPTRAAIQRLMLTARRPGLITMPAGSSNRYGYAGRLDRRRTDDRLHRLAGSATFAGPDPGSQRHRELTKRMPLRLADPDARRRHCGSRIADDQNDDAQPRASSRITAWRIPDLRSLNASTNRR